MSLTQGSSGILVAGSCRNRLSLAGFEKSWEGVPPPKPSSRSPRGRGSRLFKPCSLNTSSVGAVLACKGQALRERVALP